MSKDPVSKSEILVELMISDHTLLLKLFNKGFVGAWIAGSLRYEDISYRFRCSRTTASESIRVHVYVL